VVLYGLETWSPTLRGVHRLGIFQKKVQKRKCGPKKKEVTRGWRKIHNEELHISWPTPHKILLRSNKGG
jgi:hypothetical protein